MAVGAGPGAAGRGDERTRRSAVAWLCWCWAWGRATKERLEDLGRGREDDVALWDPRVEKENRETVGANCVLGMKIFLLHTQ
jgi:hypothetical protein